MTGDTVSTLGIGDLARRSGLPVRTIRFYCDEGILDVGRSTGGHRRFSEADAERLDQVRRLRALGLGLAAIRAMLAGERSLAEVVAEERAALDVELATLAWRHASMRALDESAPEDRAARLDLLAAAQDGLAARAALETFWRRMFQAPTSADTVEMFLAASVPDPPEVPTPRQVLAYAEMTTIVADRQLTNRFLYRAMLSPVPHEFPLHCGVREACAMVVPLVRAGALPGPGLPLDQFVTAHASARGVRDTRTFRHALSAISTGEREPRLRRYWRLVGEVTGEPVTIGTAVCWLVDALDVTLSAHASARPPAGRVPR
ncbi:MAG TPA: MerR family transcriptional regulator [Pseudonocardiaceae bacterium]